MDIKKINEELSKLLEDNVFALSGKASEVTDLINKLAQEYGDLTIPEFIDMLIEKEKSGEEILDESLNEGYEFSRTDKAYKNYHRDKDFPQNIINTNYKCLEVEVNTNVDFRDAIIYLTNRYNQEEARLDLRLVFEQKAADINEWLGYFTLDVYDNERHSQQIKQFLRANTEELGGVEWSKSTSYDCQFGRTLFKRTPESNTQAKIELLNKFNELLQKLDDYIKGNSSKYEDELAELERIRAQAKSNKVATTTTVGKALSKSSIAKKIQALKNPTPEQLARILAAIGD